nr:MAG TPA: hypothetical protein [Caudoviricetes sp.]
MISIVLTILSVLIITTFCVLVKVKLGYLPNSLSESYYRLNELDGTGWMFQAFLAGSVITLIGPWIQVSQESIKFLAFLACGATLFVSAAPRYADLEFENSVHMWSAIISCSCGVAWCVFSGGLIPTAIVFSIGLAASLALSMKPIILIAEICTLLSVYTTIFMTIFR